MDAEVTTMTAPVMVDESGVQYTHQQLEEIVTKLTKLRDDIVAGVHPKLKVPARLRDKGRPTDTIKAFSQSAARSLPAHQPAQPAAGIASGRSPSRPSITSSVHPTSVPQPAKDALTPSGPAKLDPIFLTKADVLVRAEAQQKRHRIEDILEEQVQQKKASARHKAFDQDAIPDFDVADVLKRAQDRIKPVSSHHSNGQNGKASSTDSFDENTFYSSQMNESTTTEEIEGSKRPRVRQSCRFFMNGKPCPYGENCIFPHDPLLKQNIDRETSKPREGDGDANSEDVRTTGRDRSSPGPQTDLNHHRADQATRPSPATASQQERIAELEAELKAIKEGKQHAQTPRSYNVPKDNHESQDDSAYSPPGADDFGRDVSLRERHAPYAREVPPVRVTGEGSSQLYDFGRATSNYSPTSTRNIHVIRNHITSPIAPQPARVSPLAVTKVPQSSHDHVDQGDTQLSSRVRNKDTMSARESPNLAPHAVNTRKRRRGPDSGDRARNVLPRTDLTSEVRVKQEPVSPDPFNSLRTHRSSLAVDAGQPQFIDVSSPQFKPQERVIYQARNSPRPVRIYELDEPSPRPSLASGRRASRTTQPFAHDEPDLRRVISERQLRTPMSPTAQDYDYLNSDSRIVRAMSHAYPAEDVHGGRVRGPSTRPHSDVYTSYHQPPQSPGPQEVQVSPTTTRPMMMAPPSRRVFVDQYGNRFLEPTDRHLSNAPPIRQPHAEYQYERPTPRSASVQRPIAAETDYVALPTYDRRPQTPASSQYVELGMHPPPVPARDDLYDPLQPEVRTVYRATRAPSYYEEMDGGREGMLRVHNAHPTNDRYELSEQMPRASSVHPQPRIIQLAEAAQHQSPQVSRHVSVRPDEGHPSAVRYVTDHRPVYRYVNSAVDQGYPPDATDEGIFEASRPLYT